MFPSTHPFHSPVLPLQHLYGFPHPTLSILQSFLYHISIVSLTPPFTAPHPFYSPSFLYCICPFTFQILGVSIILSRLLFVSFSFCCSKRFISSFPHPDPLVGGLDSRIRIRIRIRILVTYLFSSFFNFLLNTFHCSFSFSLQPLNIICILCLWIIACGNHTVAIITHPLAHYFTSCVRTYVPPPRNFTFLVYN